MKFLSNDNDNDIKSYYSHIIFKCFNITDLFKGIYILDFKGLT